MKIRKNEFKFKETKTEDVLRHIKNVVQPFEPQITAN